MMSAKLWSTIKSLAIGYNERNCDKPQITALCEFTDAENDWDIAFCFSDGSEVRFISREFALDWLTRELWSGDNNG